MVWPYLLSTCNGSTLSHAKYHLRTALSKTETFWSNTPATPIYGTGQGSGISPGLCSVTYSDIFDIHSATTPGSCYHDPSDDLSTTIYNIGFVDGTTTTYADVSRTNPIPASILSSQLQSSLQKWGNLLHVAGGALKLSKTTIHLLT